MNTLNKFIANNVTYHLSDSVDEETLAKASIVLDFIPDEDTLSYGGLQFVVGDIVKVTDPNSSTGYSFYRLESIDGGKANWVKVTSESNIVGETCTVTLTTNQSNTDDLKNTAVVTVQYDGNSVSQTYSGTDLAFTIPVGSEYTVSFGSVNGYTTPSAPSSKTAVAGGNNIVNAEYKTQKVTVSIDGITDKSGKTIQFTYKDESNKTVSPTVTTDGYGNVTVNIPWVSYKVKAIDSFDGFSTPAEQEITTLSATKSITLTYEPISSEGVFIMDKSGNLWDIDSWDTSNNANALGVAIKTANHSFVMYGYYASKTSGGANRTYASSNYDASTEVSGLTTYESISDALNESTWGDTNTSILASHFGYGYTNDGDIIYNVNDVYEDEGDTLNAFGFVKLFSPGYKNGEWYIPTAREWRMVSDNYSLVDKAIRKIGGYFTEGYGPSGIELYDWSSTQTIYSSTPMGNTYGFFTFSDLADQSTETVPNANAIYRVVQPFASLD